MPSVNLVSNIGFGEDATHTKTRSIFADMPIGNMTFPLVSPPSIVPFPIADEFTAKKMFTIDITRSVLRKLRGIFE